MSHTAPENNAPMTQPNDAPRAQTPEAAAAGRDANGRFAKNNKGGPGNPHARRTAAVRKVFAEAVSEQDLIEVAQSLTQKAKQGDVAAARLVLSYVIGKPTDTVEPDTLDLEEFKQYEEQVRHFKALPAVAAAPDLEMACTIARAARPGIAEAASKDLSHALLNGEFPEGSPFSDPEYLECQEATDSDTAPSPIGSNRAPDLVGGGAVPVVEDLRQGQELLQELGLTGAAAQAPVAAAAAGPKVDVNVVAVAVMMLYEAMLAANGGNNPFCAEEETPQGQGRDARQVPNSAAAQPGIARPAPSPNDAIGASGNPRRPRASSPATSPAPPGTGPSPRTRRDPRQE